MFTFQGYEMQVHSYKLRNGSVFYVCSFTNGVYSGEATERSEIRAVNTAKRAICTIIE